MTQVIRTYTILQMGENNLVQRYLEEDVVMPPPPKGFIHSFNKVLLNTLYFSGSVLINRNSESNHSLCFPVAHSLG